MFINFSDIPGNNNLFLDYLYEFENVSDFFKHNFRDKENFSKHFQNVTDFHRSHQEIISDIISDQYKGLNTSAKTQKNISLLKNKKTLTIVTGQQLGLLGGPLYTFYKIITAIKLTQYLTERYDDFNFIPVFWLEGDDHDFNEVRWLNFINEENNLVEIKYNDELAEEDNRGCIGNKIFEKGINQFIHEIENVLRETEFKPVILSMIKDIYQEGKSFKQAFKELLFYFFDSYGLIIFDPQDIVVKKLLVPVFKKEFENFRVHTEKLISTSAKLEENYHAQVKVRPINLFMTYENGRYSIEPLEDNYKLRHKRVKFTKEEILNLIENNPEQFSPNVLLRPICQDYILPTAFYVGGPAEICYSAQVLPLYNFFEMIPPIIYPRSSVTIIEKNIAGILDKYHLTIKDMFLNKEKITDKVIASLSEINIDAELNNTKDKLNTIFNDLKLLLNDIDKTLSDSSDKLKIKFEQGLEELRIKTVEAQKRKYEIALRQINRALISVLPNNTLQEREMNYFYFANKYGIDLIKLLFEEIAINKFEHQLINL